MGMSIEKTDVCGFETALRAMRNPMNSWDRSDTTSCDDCGLDNCNHCIHDVYASNVLIGANDMKTSTNLLKGGPEESKHLRMVHVTADVTMPRYWWSEMDTYKFVEKVSCSTMHRLLNTDDPITEDLFLMTDGTQYSVYNELIKTTIMHLEELRQHTRNLQKEKPEGYAEDIRKDLVIAKRILPECYLQKRTIDTNYQELRNIYRQRRNHRLKEEWGFFCDWVETLPYSEEFIIRGLKNDTKN